MVEKRKFPYPYDGMLSISNDIDSTSLDLFKKLHRFLNTENQTEMGQGLGLDIADSFWMYNRRGEDNPEQEGNYENAMSYWVGRDFEEEWNAKAIRKYIDCGWIDSLHTFGDFSRVGGFERKHAVEAIEELKKQNIEIEVWTNHGGKKNKQNFHGGVKRVNQQGDRPNSNAYHTDITIPYGIKYIWNRPLAPLDEKIGYSSIIEPVSLWDGQQVWGFKRYARIDPLWLYGLKAKTKFLNYFYKIFSKTYLAKGWHPERLNEQLSEENLKKIVDNNYFSIIAQHLGCRDSLLPPSAVEALRRLKKRHEGGEILVTRTSRLLEYNRVWKYLDYKVKKENDSKIINIKSINDPILGSASPSIKQVRGITFYVDDPESTCILLNEKKISTEQIELNPNDGYKKSIGISWFDPDKKDYT